MPTSLPKSVVRRLSPLLALALLVAAFAAPATAQTPRESRPLERAVTVDGINEHLDRFQEFADRFDDTRASGTPGYDLSAQYIRNTLRRAGYEVRYQSFPFTFFSAEVEEGREVTPTERDLAPIAMTYTPSTPEDGLTAAVTAVPVDATTGCEAEDYAGADYTGTIALIQRGGCTFAQKSATAAAAGAIAALIYNNIDGPLNGTLGAADATTIPTAGITLETGQAVAADVAAGETTVFLNIQALTDERVTRNVIAETRRGRVDNVVMAGAHLDSVTDGPGINDNGSGSAVLLETALQMAELDIRPRNKVRFAWWGAEELGLIGSNYYVANLDSNEIQNIALYLNFDMVGSPNFVRFVYDGSSSDEGSGAIEQRFVDYFDSRGQESDPTAFDGRSDYLAFINEGIPAGGLFSGAEGIKTEGQAAIYGGTAGEAYDPCYHQACDDRDNVSERALNQFSNAIAHAVYTYAMDTSEVNGVRPTMTAAAAAKAQRQASQPSGAVRQHGHAAHGHRAVR